jgi:hypothetical protein
MMLCQRILKAIQNAAYKISRHAGGALKSTARLVYKMTCCWEGARVGRQWSPDCSQCDRDASGALTGLH